MNVVASFLISLLVSTVIIVYGLNLPLMASNNAKDLVYEYYYKNWWKSLLLDIVLVAVYFYVASLFAKILGVRDFKGRVVVLIATTVLISGSFCMYFLRRPISDAFFSRWFHKASWGAVLYDAILLTLIYIVFERLRAMSLS